ncbi:MAG TPA: outer membrane lipoprotein carrier protein LolA [Verrucomicrobiota bacterium]|nr:outer membrane lipoprotein carrier protein LolA [Verrucomicrobiota bacterium]
MRATKRPEGRAPQSFLLLGLLFFLFASPSAFGQTNIVSTWLAAQTNVQSWSADLVQTRRLKTLAQPLVAQGRVWFAAPNRFRWEIGSPPDTIAIRDRNQLYLVYPRFNRAERYPLDGNQTGPWRDALALLEAGFPRSEADLNARFHILRQSVTNSLCEIVLQPRSAAARRMMPGITIAFDTNDFSLRSTELQMADGSTMRNDFTNAVLNPPIPESVFSLPTTGELRIVEPVKPN